MFVISWTINWWWSCHFSSVKTCQYCHQQHGLWVSGRPCVQHPLRVILAFRLYSVDAWCDMAAWEPKCLPWVQCALWSICTWSIGSIGSHTSVKGDSEAELTASSIMLIKCQNVTKVSRQTRTAWAEWQESSWHRRWMSVKWGGTYGDVLLAPRIGLLTSERERCSCWALLVWCRLGERVILQDTCSKTMPSLKELSEWTVLAKRRKANTGWRRVFCGLKWMMSSQEKESTGERFNVPCGCFCDSWGEIYCYQNHWNSYLSHSL